MINSVYNLLHRNRPLDHNNPNPNQFSSQRVQNIIVARYIGDSLHILQEYPDVLKKVRERLTSTVFDHDRLFQISDLPPTDDQIFNWFINSDFAPRLHRRAIEARDLYVDAFFQKSGVDVNRADETTGNTPLILAVRSHQPVVVSRLMRTGADTLARNREGKSALEQAIYQYQYQKTGYEKYQFLETLRQLLSDTRLFDQLTGEAINFIFTKTERDVAELFIDQTMVPLRPIITELINSKRQEAPNVLRLILSRYPAQVNERGRLENNKTPLMEAAEQGNQAALLALLEQPAIDIEAVCEIEISFMKTKWTAYSLALGNGKTDCLKLLEDFGAQKMVHDLAAIEQLLSYLQRRMKLLIAISLLLIGTYLMAHYLLSLNTSDVVYILLFLPVNQYNSVHQDINRLKKLITSARQRFHQEQGAPAT